jgi:hemerythrin-like domain-containing protein
VMRKFGSSEDFDPAVITDSANIVREFIEDYHEKSEEDEVFPRFKQAGKMDRLIGEDTVLFPRLKTVVSANEYEAMAEDFEKKEHELFGEDGFDKMVHRVAAIEESLGIWT